MLQHTPTIEATRNTQVPTIPKDQNNEEIQAPNKKQNALDF
jgi:hypothetical protein